MTASIATRMPVVGKAVGPAPWPVVIYVIAVLFPASFYAGPLFLTILRVILLVMAPVLLIRLFSGAYGRMLLTDWAFLGFMGWMGLALTIRSPDMAVTQMGSLGIEFLGGYLMGRAYVRDKETMYALILVLAKAAIFLLPFAAYEAVTGRSLLLSAIEAIPGMSAPKQFDMPPRMGLIRVQSVFPHPILFGMYASASCALILVGLRGVVSTPKRYFLTAASVGCVMLSLSSGALLAVVLQMMLVGWALVFRNNKYCWHFFLALAAVFYVVVDMGSNRSPLDVFMSYATFSSGTAYIRKLIFDWGMVNVRANPIFGLGMNDWVRAHFLKSSVDNFWLLNTMRYGIPGFLLLALGYFGALWQIGRRNLSASPRLVNLRLAWVITFSGLGFTLCTVHIWNNAYSFVFFMFGAGMWLQYANPTADQDQGPQGGQAETVPGGSLLRSERRYTRFPPRSAPGGGLLATVPGQGIKA